MMQTAASINFTETRESMADDLGMKDVGSKVYLLIAEME